MTVAEKLNLLMNLTGTRNRRLAQALCVDPSLISRFRSGQREIPENSGYLADIADFFATRYYETDCSAVLDQVMINYLDPVLDFRTMLEQWLSEADKVPITELLQRQPASKAKKAAPFRCFSGPDAWQAAIAAFSGHLRTAGRGARLKLLQQTALPTAQARAAIDQQLTAALLPFLQRGGTAIRVMPQISTLTAESETAHAWLELLLTGNLQLFEYDGLQENALQTDLIVISGVAALQCLRAAGETKVTVQLTTDPFVVAGLETTVDTYLIACRPVSKITSLQKTQYFEESEFPAAVPLMYVYASLPVTSIPVDFLRDGREDLAWFSDLAFFCEQQRRRLAAMAKRQPVAELFPLLTAEEVLAGAAAPATDLTEKPQTRRYWPQTYARQLSTILRLLETEPNYHVCLLPPGEARTNFCFFGASKMTLFPLQNGPGLQLMTVSCSGVSLALRQKYASILHTAQADPSHRARVIETLLQRRKELELAARSFNKERDLNK